MMLGDGEIWRLPPAVWYHPDRQIISRSRRPFLFYSTWRGSLEVWWRPENLPSPASWGTVDGAPQGRMN